MSPKEKATEIYFKLYIPKYCYAKAGMSSNWRKLASKKNALIAVEEIIQTTNNIAYWQQVKEEINSL